MRAAMWTALLCLVLTPSARAAESVTGTYKMRNGEVLIQQTKDGRIRFSLNATYQANVGEVSGEVPLSGDTASYADPDLDCALTLRFAPGKLVVSQDGPCGMGLNVSGSGTYKQVSTASPDSTNDRMRRGKERACLQG
jgi:hypothetical protein